MFVFRADLQREEAREIADEAHSSLSQFQRRMQLRVQEVFALRIVAELNSPHPQATLATTATPLASLTLESRSHRSRAPASCANTSPPSA